MGIASGERNEQTLVLDTLKARFVEPLPEKLIGDKAYDSDPLDRELATLGVDMVAPNLSTRAVQSQDRRKLKRYRRRWLVERLFAWLMRCRRLVSRYESKAENFLGFVKLACVVLLSRRLRDAF